MFLTGGNNLTNGFTGIAGLITFILANIAFYLYDRYVAKERIFTKVIGEY